MKSRWVVVCAVAVAFSLAGCKKDSAPESPSGGLSPEQVAKDPEAAAKKIQTAMEKGELTAIADSKSGGGQLNCDRLIPQALREKYLKDTEISAGSMLNRTLMCSANRNGSLAYHFTWDCRPTSTLAQFQQKAEQKGRKLEGLGRAAFGSEQQLEFYDDDADCAVTAASYVDGEKIIEVARELQALLKPDLLPAVEKGKYALSCDKVVPAEVREKYFARATPSADSIMKDQMTCKFELPDFKTHQVNYTCGGSYGPDFIPQMKSELAKRKMDAVDVAVGKGGLYQTMMGVDSVSFVDAETGCLVSVSAMEAGKDKAVELSRALEQALTVDAAQ